MPAKSKAQFRLMKAAQYNPKIAKKVGISEDVAGEFTQSNVGKKAYGKLPEKMRKGGKPKQKPMVPNYPGKSEDDFAADLGVVDYDNIPTKRRQDPVEMKTSPQFIRDTEDQYKIPNIKDFEWMPKGQYEVKKGGGVGPSLSVGRGEKLPAEKGAGLTAKGREKYNRETGSNLKPPQPEGGKRRDSFCARMEPVAKSSERGSRARASMKRWNCPGW